MLPDVLDRLEAEINRIGLTDHLKSEWEYWSSEVERDYEVSLGEFIEEWENRHEDDKKAGWLDRASLNVIREAYIAARIAIPRQEILDNSLQVINLQVWFQMNGVKYCFEPDYDDGRKGQR